MALLSGPPDGSIYQMNLGPNTAFAKPCPYTRQAPKEHLVAAAVSARVPSLSFVMCRHASAGNAYRPYFWNSQSLLSSGQT